MKINEVISPGFLSGLMKGAGVWDTYQKYSDEWDSHRPIKPATFTPNTQKPASTAPAPAPAAPSTAPAKTTVPKTGLGQVLYIKHPSNRIFYYSPKSDSWFEHFGSNWPNDWHTAQKVNNDSVIAYLAKAMADKKYQIAQVPVAQQKQRRRRR